ncbi:MAG: ABC transporter permease [Armatimonadota bacterium]
MTTYRWDDELGVWMPTVLQRDGLRLRWERLRIIALREMRSFMRGSRAPLALLVCTALAAAANLALIYFSPIIRAGGGTPEQMVEVGKRAFHGVVLLEAVLVVLLMPLLTAGMVAWEYQRHTIEGLLLTRLTGMDIVSGKLLAATGFLAIALCCVVPVISTAALVGGVSLGEVVLTQLTLLSIALCAGAFGLFMSARCRDARVAAVLALLLTLACSALLPILPFLARALTKQPFLGRFGLVLKRLRFRNIIGIVILLAACVILFFDAVLGLLFLAVSADPVFGLAGLVLGGRLPFPFQWFSDYWWFSLLAATAGMLLCARVLLHEAGALIRDREVPD